MKKIDLIWRHLILRALEAPVTMSSMAEVLGVSVGLAHHAAHRLAAAQVAEVSKKGVRVTNPWAAATLWAYTSRMDAKDEIARGCFLGSPDQILRELPAGGALSGAAAWPAEERPAPFRRVQAYLDEAGAGEFLSRLSRSPTAEDANLVIYRKDRLFDRYANQGRAPWPHVLADVLRSGEMFAPDYVRDLEDRAQSPDPWASFDMEVMRP